MNPPPRRRQFQSNQPEKTTSEERIIYKTRSKATYAQMTDNKIATHETQPTINDLRPGTEQQNLRELTEMLKQIMQQMTLMTNLL